MRLTVHAFVSLDGVMQGPGSPEEDPSGGFDRGGWLVPHDPTHWGEVVDGWFRRTDALLYGRTTYDLMRGFWPQVTDPDDFVAGTLNTGPKYIASGTLTDEDADWGPATVLRGDIVEAVRELKDQPGGELQIHGSWELVRTLHDAGLVDTYRLLQFPVVVGDGKRLFADGAVPATYEVDSSESRVLADGVVSLALDQVEVGTIGTGEYTVEDGKDVVA